MKKDKFSKMILETEYSTIFYQFDYIDPNLDDYFQAFKTLMIGATFSEEVINNYLKSLSNETF